MSSPSGTPKWVSTASRTESRLPALGLEGRDAREAEEDDALAEGEESSDDVADAAWVSDLRSSCAFPVVWQAIFLLRSLRLS